MNFSSEQKMVDSFEVSLISDFLPKNDFIKVYEPKGLFGIPDLILVENSCSLASKTYLTIAIEFKLKNWKRALSQAFKYRSFANLSFVILDNAFIKPALKNIELFEKSNIGLISYDGNNVIFHHRPSNKTPFSKTQSEKLLEIILNQN